VESLSRRLFPGQPCIHLERASDDPAIATVHLAAFARAAAANLVNALGDNGNLVISVVAEVNDWVVGHLGLSPITIEGHILQKPPLGLAPVAVLPSYQDQGIGTSMILFGLSRCEALGVPYIVALGNPGYYGRFGFVAASQFGLGNEYGADDAFMVKETSPNGLMAPRGIVRYGQEFASL